MTSWVFCGVVEWTIQNSRLVEVPCWTRQGRSTEGRGRRDHRAILRRDSGVGPEIPQRGPSRHPGNHAGRRLPGHQEAAWFVLQDRRQHSQDKNRRTDSRDVRDRERLHSRRGRGNSQADGLVRGRTSQARQQPLRISSRRKVVSLWAP
ncbi:hypothetical protein RvY_11636-2 [Ramazzottius varieornatus]|uniref:Uncharacterized protein n=1 Tax=Ramazzottius varieornatus TaxID=947166 RepID=A0A1D1VPI3_RAMVA|nr:hypothetical protein RvY_11636-2 [Ramazzottius varieornatus]